MELSVGMSALPTNTLLQKDLLMDVVLLERLRECHSYDWKDSWLLA